VQGTLPGLPHKAALQEFFSFSFFSFFPFRDVKIFGAKKNGQSKVPRPFFIISKNRENIPYNRMQHSTSELVTVKEIFSLCPTERRPNSANHFGDLPFRGGLCGLRSHTRANNVDRASNYSMF
jgi:hypothetical protein